MLAGRPCSGYCLTVSQVTRSERIQALLFLILGIAAIGVVVALLIGLPFAAAERTYYLDFRESVTGLQEEAPVRYKGVTCGTIREIRVKEDDPEVIRVTLSLRPDTPVTQSTTARIASGTILGPYHIELLDSRRQSPILPEGSEIPASASTFTRLISKGETLGDQLAVLVSQLQEFTQPEKVELLWETVEQARDLMAAAQKEVTLTGPALRDSILEFTELAKRLSALADSEGPKIKQALTDAAASALAIRNFLESGRLERLLTSTESELSKVSEDILKDGKALRLWLEGNQLAPQMNAAVDSVRDLMAELQRLTATLGSESVALLREDIAPTLDGIRRSAQGMERLLMMLQRQPNALIFGAPKEERPLPRRQQ